MVTEIELNKVYSKPILRTRFVARIIINTILLSKYFPKCAFNKHLL